jgi:AcrR family transcriptional regulator
MTGKSRRDEDAEQSRVAIIAAAVECFATEGFAATTMDAVAAEARMAKGGVYHHFASKADLFEAAFVAMEEQLLESLLEATRDVTDAREEMRIGIELFLAHCQRPDFRRIVVSDAPAALGWTRWKALEDKYFLGAIEAAVEGLAAVGYDISSVKVTSRLLLAALNEAGQLVAAARHPHAEARRARDALLAMIDGSRPQ